MAGWGGSPSVYESQQRAPQVQQAVREAGYDPTSVNYALADRAFKNTSWDLTTGALSPGSMPSYPTQSYSGGGGGGWGGGGGGGGGGPAGITQEQMDWIAQMLGKGQVDPLEAIKLKLPKFRSKFRPQMYNQLLRQLNRGVQRDTRTANQAYNQLDRFLGQNYTNAFNNPNAMYGTMQGAPGMGAQQMARMAQNQGVDPATVATQFEGAGAADRAFGNLWNVLGATEDRAQRNRLTAAKQDRQATQNALAIAALQGRTGIGLQRAGAKDEWRQRLEDMNYQRRLQQAMGNWTQRNQVAATNVQNDVAYRNSLIQALIGMVPSLAEGTTMPDIEDLLGLPPEERTGRRGRNERIGGGRGTGRRVGIPEEGRQGGPGKRRAERRARRRG
jgi:hypothetical protein